MRYLRRMNDQPLLFWATAVVALAAVLGSGSLRVPGLAPATDDAPSSQHAAAAAGRLMTLVSPPQVGASPEEVRAWLETVRAAALEGAEHASDSEDLEAALLWSDVLAAISAYPAEDVSSQDISRLTSRLTIAVLRLEGHYREA